MRFFCGRDGYAKKMDKGNGAGRKNYVRDCVNKMFAFGCSRVVVVRSAGLETAVLWPPPDGDGERERVRFDV